MTATQPIGNPETSPAPPAGMPTVLLIEDDRRLTRSLREGLEENDFHAYVAHTAEEARRLLQQISIGLIVLDLGLPDLDGIELLRGMRRTGIHVPVLILTARDTLDERVTGLEAGADDYLPKPFAFAELLARLRALNRRRSTQTTPPAVLQVGDLRLNLMNRQVHRDGRTVDLGPREFDVLACLAIQAGATVSRDTLMREVWKLSGRATPMNNVIDVLMTRLREKVDKPFDRPILQTIRGIGYRLTGVRSWDPS